MTIITVIFCYSGLPTSSFNYVKKLLIFVPKKKFEKKENHSSENKHVVPWFIVEMSPIKQNDHFCLYDLFPPTPFIEGEGKKSWYYIRTTTSTISHKNTFSVEKKGTGVYYQRLMVG